jgi:peptidoglycan/LPS O-acetylase OafA/YrhL
MAGFLGMLAGGVIGTWLLGALLEWAIFKRMGISAKARIVLSCVTAIILAVIIYGFSSADDGEWNPREGLIIYPLAGLIVCVVRLYRSTPEGAQDQIRT